jgi:hypothetical protein
MKKILISVLVIAVAVSVSAIGLSGAWFSDVEESTGDFVSPQNVVAAGVMELDPLVGISETICLEPCDEGFGYLLLHLREDSSPAKAFVHIKNIVNEGGKHPEAEDACDPDDEINAIEDWLTLDLRVYQDTYGTETVFTEGEETLLKTIIHENHEVKLSCAECFWIPLGITMDPCTYYWVEFSFHLQGETPNCYQGDKCKFDINVLATETLADDPDDLFPLGMKSIRLENKDADWQILPNDDIYGLINYWVGSDWGGKLIVKGLTANSWYFLTLQGEWPEDGQSTTDILLGQLNAADPPAPNDPSTGGGIGYYGYVQKLTATLGWADIALFQTDGNGEATIMVPYTSPAVDPVWGALNAPTLQNGTYQGVRAVVKYVGTGAAPDWGKVAAGGDPILFETAPMDDFTVP